MISMGAKDALWIAILAAPLRCLSTMRKTPSPGRSLLNQAFEKSDEAFARRGWQLTLHPANP